MSDETTRWTVIVSKETDVALRSFLAQRGMKKGDLSRFVEEAVKWRVFDQTVAEARERFADLPPDELQALIDEATAAVRADMFRLPPREADRHGLQNAGCGAGQQGSHARPRRPQRLQGRAGAEGSRRRRARAADGDARMTVGEADGLRLQAGRSIRST